MKGFVKRLNCLLCTIIIIAVTTLSAPLKAQATAIPGAVGSEATIEALMVLWNLVMNSFVASGAVDAVANYDTEKSIMDAFMGSLKTQGVNQEYTAYLTNGQYVSIDDLVAAYDKGTITLPEWWVDEWDVDEDGEDVISFPNEQVWGKYRVGDSSDYDALCEAWAKRNEELGGGGGDNGNSQEPKEPEFSRLKTFAITGGFLATISAFIDDVFNGEIEGVEFASHTPDKTFTGFTYNDAGQIIVNMQFSRSRMHDGMSYWYNVKFEYNGILNSGYKICYYNDYTQNVVNIYYGENVPMIFDDYEGTVSLDSVFLRWPSDSLINPSRFNANIPQFSDRDECYKFISGELGEKHALNYKEINYSYPELINSISDVFTPMTDTQLSPSVLQSTYTGMKNAYETDIEPNISPDVSTNTQTYTDTMKDVITETVPQYTPTPSPEPSPVLPESGTDTDIETGVDDIDNYRRDLRMLFPFCLPFDFIALLQAMDAEPVTPYFEIPFVVPALNIEMALPIDLSFLDDVMEGLRKMELVGFIVFLIFATGKVIKW